MGQAVDRVRRIALGQHSPEAAARREEQLGQTDAERPDGCLIWLLTETAAEAGPAPALAFALSQRIEQPVQILVTPLEDLPLVQSVEDAVIHQFAPGDTEGTVQRFLDHWRPDFGLVIGHPARPHLLAAAQRRKIPLFHAIARRDTRTQSRKWPSYLGGFQICFAASASDANLLRSHLRNSDTRVEITGPLSDTVYALPCNEAECDDLASLLGGRPVWLAAEVTADELETVQAAHRKAFRSAHRLLLVLVPREPNDADGITAKLEAQGWRVAQKIWARLSLPCLPPTRPHPWHKPAGRSPPKARMWWNAWPNCWKNGTLRQRATRNAPTGLLEKYP